MKKTVATGLTSLVLAAGLPALVPAMAAAESLRTEIFAVRCYDVGRSALSGREGIVRVESGWQGGREVNTVTYDQDRIGREAIEARLEQAGTFLGFAGAASSPGQKRAEPSQP